jgi:hypothetical protein
MATTYLCMEKGCRRVAVGQGNYCADHRGLGVKTPPARKVAGRDTPAPKPARTALSKAAKKVAGKPGK